MTKETKQTMFTCLYTSGVLLVICALIAGLLAVVHLLTAPRIAAAEAAARDAAVSVLFPDGTAEELSLPEGVAETVTAAYLVTTDGVPCGYAVAVSPRGYKDTISMLVGISSEGTVCGIEILAQSETAGIGSRALAAHALSRYNGKSGTLSLGSDIDAITGATVTSRGVLDGVNAALAAHRLLTEGGVQ